jgi:predicted transcriptional regulator of viral defense system
MKPNENCLYQVAEGQRGYVTAAQAHSCGYSRALLAHHAKVGMLQRVRRGLYRLRQYPSSPREEVLAAWLAAGQDAVVSHESALDILDLSDLIPDSIHITIPRGRRSWRPPEGVALHTTLSPLGPSETTEREGIRITSPARTLLDVAEGGGPPDQVVRAIREAIRRGLTSPRELSEGATSRGARTARLVTAALESQQA